MWYWWLDRKKKTNGRFQALTRLRAKFFAHQILSIFLYFVFGIQSVTLCIFIIYQVHTFKTI